MYSKESSKTKKIQVIIPKDNNNNKKKKKSLSQSLTRLNLHANRYIQLQKSVILDTCSILRNFLNYK